MKFYANAKIIVSGKKEFEDKEGKPIKYYENIVKSEDGGTATLNSGADYSDCEGKDGVIEVMLKDNGKLTLKRFIEDGNVEVPEAEIA